jgi:threonine aldolase
MHLDLAGDSGAATPADVVRQLADAVASNPPEIDVYGVGGAVGAFERRMAAALGKERAVLMPTGTLANVLAARAHARRTGASRVIVQTESHLANDSGDALAELAGLTPRPIAHADFTAETIAAEIDRASTARVAAPVAAVVIESPVRRLAGAVVPLAEQQAICAAAHARGVACHLDGARLYIAAGFLGRTVAEIAAPYDSVYVSLYKYFGVPFGAILAGPAALIDGLFHERRRFGGGLNQMWPIAVVADGALDRMAAEWRAVADRARAVTARLVDAGVALTAPEHGSNVFRLSVAPGAAAAIRAHAGALGIRLPVPDGDVFEIKANATWLDGTAETVTARLLEVFAARD